MQIGAVLQSKQMWLPSLEQPGFSGTSVISVVVVTSKLSSHSCKWQKELSLQMLQLNEE
jgi:hypothetical protein